MEGQGNVGNVSHGSKNKKNVNNNMLFEKTIRMSTIIKQGKKTWNEIRKVGNVSHEQQYSVEVHVEDVQRWGG